MIMKYIIIIYEEKVIEIGTTEFKVISSNLHEVIWNRSVFLNCSILRKQFGTKSIEPIWGPNHPYYKLENSFIQASLISVSTLQERVRVNIFNLQFMST
jgi:hypothetical protein